MGEQTKPESEELLERVHAARQELDGLISEQRRLGDDLERARREDHEARMEAVRGGAGSIRSAVSSLVSRVRGVEDRGAILPELIWTARMHVLELEAAHNKARHAELEEPEREAKEEFEEVDALLPKVQKRRQDALDRVTAVNRERRDLQRREAEAKAELERLKRAGPARA